MNNKKIVVYSSTFMDIDFLEMDGHHEVYNISIADIDAKLYNFKVSYYDVIGPAEVQIYLYDGSKKIMIGSVRRTNKNYRKIILKTAFISYMIGIKKLKINS